MFNRQKKQTNPVAVYPVHLRNEVSSKIYVTTITQQKDMLFPSKLQLHMQMEPCRITSGYYSNFKESVFFKLQNFCVWGKFPVFDVSLRRCNTDGKINFYFCSFTRRYIPIGTNLKKKKTDFLKLDHDFLKFNQHWSLFVLFCFVFFWIMKKVPNVNTPEFLHYKFLKLDLSRLS